MLIAHWYLMTGIFFHILLDGLSGLLQINGLMSQQYARLDKRYVLPFQHEGLVVHLVSILEMLIMAPLCLSIYIGYYQYSNKSAMNKQDKKKGLLWVHSLEIIVSCLQLIGVFFYNGQELIHIVRDDGLQMFDVDYNLQFTLDYIFYFWFGTVFCQLIWIIVPIYQIKRAHKDIKSIIKKQ